MGVDENSLSEGGEKVELRFFRRTPFSDLLTFDPFYPDVWGGFMMEKGSSPVPMFGHHTYAFGLDLCFSVEVGLRGSETSIISDLHRR